MSKKNNQFILNRNWKYFCWEYLLSVLTIPLFGIGLIAFYFVRKKHKSVTYKVTDRQLISIDNHYEQHIDLADIEHIRLAQSPLQAKLKVGTLILECSTAPMELEGIENPKRIKDLIEQAAKALQKQHNQVPDTKNEQPKYNPGSMPKLDYLTGLWQQGLISNEDYEEERKHFE